MTNHYHLLVETGDATLSRGRLMAILVQKDAYLLELANYISPNPVRARIVQGAQEWPFGKQQA